MYLWTISKVKESDAREIHRRKLMLVADNLVNYFRGFGFREELKRLKK